MKKIILIAASIAWVLFWWWWYTCKICSTCFCFTAETKAVPPKTFIPESGPVLYHWSDTMPYPQKGWQLYLDSLRNNLKLGQMMEIEGQYSAEETNPSSFINLGLARANGLKLLLPDSLQSRINLNSLLISKREGMETHPFISSAINLRMNTDKIQETAEKAIIYFKYNSDQRIKEPEIENYLKNLAKIHKDSRASFVIRGFTDNSGEEIKNKLLGLKRAESIKKYLIKAGIDPARISTQSLGEALPIADNDTKEGKEKNRRTEIEIIQKF